MANSQLDSLHRAPVAVVEMVAWPSARQQLEEWASPERSRSLLVARVAARVTVELCRLVWTATSRRFKTSRSLCLRNLLVAPVEMVALRSPHLSQELSATQPRCQLQWAEVAAAVATVVMSRLQLGQVASRRTEVILQES